MPNVTVLSIPKILVKNMSLPALCDHLFKNSPIIPPPLFKGMKYCSSFPIFGENKVVLHTYV